MHEKYDRGYKNLQFLVPTVILLYGRFLIRLIWWCDLRLSVVFKTVAARGLVNGRGPRSGRDSVLKTTDNRKVC